MSHPAPLAHRQQQSRKKGSRTPEGVVYVGRPTLWGNPFRADRFGHMRSVRLYRRWIEGTLGERALVRGRIVICRKITTDHYGRIILRCTVGAVDLSCAQIAPATPCAAMAACGARDDWCKHHSFRRSPPVTQRIRASS